MDSIFTSENLDNLDELVYTISKLTINDAGCELNKATASDTQGYLTSYPDTVTNTSNGHDTITHASNGILDEKLLRCSTIGEVPVHLPLANPVILVPQTMMMPAVKKIFTDATSGKTRTNWKLRQVIRAGGNGTVPWNIVRASGISKNSSPYLIGIIGDTDPHCGLKASQDIGDIRQSTFQDLRKYNKLDTSIN